MQTTLITLEELRYRCKPISKLIDDDDVTPYIIEAQNLDLKPKLTDQLLIDIKKFAKVPADATADYTMLLDGGIWDNKCDQSFELNGLKTTLAYYTYCRLINNTSYDLSRFGLRDKTDSFSANVEAKERRRMENDARSTADIYMQECLQYLAANCEQFPVIKRRINLRQENNIKFRVLPDPK